MKAVIYTRYGPADVLEIADIAKPVPKDDEVLIKLRAASLNPADWRVMEGMPGFVRMMFAMRPPSVENPGRVGIDVAGEVEAVGKNVTQFKPGDAVFGGVRGGGLAEYACTPASRLASKPENITFEQAAAVPVAGITALQGLRDKGRLQPGQKVLINGAAGGVGTFAVQVGKALGAHVTGVTSTKNVELVRSLGAERVIDYTREDFTKSGERYDVLLDNVGNHSLAACRGVLNGKGVLVIAGGPKKGSAILLRAFKAMVMSPVMTKKMKFFIARIETADLTAMAEMMKSGKVTPVVDRLYRMSEVVEAMRYLETGHARGKVVVRVE